MLILLTEKSLWFCVTFCIVASVNIFHRDPWNMIEVSVFVLETT